jgi:hypothetical protein
MHLFLMKKEYTKKLDVGTSHMSDNRQMSVVMQRLVDRELLAVYEAMKHFCHMLEARHFTIFTDHKPLIYAFQQKM